MSLANRRNVPPPLSLPTGAGGLTVHVEGEDVKTPVRTPMPFTPLPIQDDSAMTPDTAEFPKPGWPTVEWTEEEDGFIETYLAKPPRTESLSYPPGELPPPAVIAEIARQIVRVERPRSGWTRSFDETRARVFHIARQESMRQVGGYHRRTPSDPKHKSPEDQRPEITTELDLTSVIEHVEQEMVIPEFSQSLRLSDDQHLSDRAARAPLSSPLEMHFNIPTPEPPKRVPVATGPTHTGVLRPASLLQRGRSFTSQDLLDEAEAAPPPQPPTQAKDAEMDFRGDESDLSASSHSHRMSAADMRNSISSPVSNITNSPPSSMSSHSVLDNEDVDLDTPPAHDSGPGLGLNPHTPLEQTTFNLDTDAATTPTNRATAAPATTHIGPSDGQQTPSISPLAPLEPQSAPQLARKMSCKNRAEDGGPTPEKAIDRDSKRQRTDGGGVSTGAGTSSSRTSGHVPTLSHDSVFGPAL